MNDLSDVCLGKHLSGQAQVFSNWSRRDGGYAMAGLLVALGVMGIMLSAALPVWSQSAKREREAELVFRGEQYARAIELYQRQFVGAYPPDIRTLVDRKFLRKEYQDPMTEDGEFQIVYLSQVDDLRGDTAAADRPGEPTSEEPQRRLQPEPIRFGDREEGGIVGVVSRSDEESLRVYNGRERYNEWAFIYVPTATPDGAVAPGGPQPSLRGPGGEPVGEDRRRFDLGASGSRRAPAAGLPPRAPTQPDSVR